MDENNDKLAKRYKGNVFNPLSSKRPERTKLKFKTPETLREKKTITTNRKTPTLRFGDNLYASGNDTGNNRFISENPLAVNKNTPRVQSQNSDFLGNFNQSLKDLQDIVKENSEKSKGFARTQINLLQGLGKISKSLEELSQKLPEFSSSIQQQKASVEDLKNQLKEGENKLKESVKQVGELSKEKDSLTKEIEDSRKMMEELRSKNEKDMADTEENITKMKEQLEQVRMSNDEKDVKYQSDLQKAIEQQQKELADMKSQHDEFIQSQESNLSKLQEEKSNVQSDIVRLTQENQRLMEDNNRMIENIKNATMIINKVVVQLQNMANVKDNMSPKFNAYYDEIENYIQLISNTLNSAANSGDQMIAPVSSVNEGVNEGLSENDGGNEERGGRKTKKRMANRKGRKTMKRKGKKTMKQRKGKKMSGGYVYGKYKSKYSNTYSEYGNKGKKSRKHKHRHY